MFEAVLKRFQRVGAGGGVPLEKKTRLAGSKSNRRTARAKIFPRNGRNCLKSRSAEAWITRFPVRRSLVRKSHRNGLKIARLPAQICLSRCCIMRIANGEDTRFENRSLATATTRQKPHSVGVGENYCLHANQHRARVHCVRFHRKPLMLTWTPQKVASAFGFQFWTFNVHSVLGACLINSPFSEIRL